MKIESKDIKDWIIKERSNVQGMADAYMVRDNQIGLDDEQMCEFEKYLARLDIFNKVYSFIESLEKEG